MNRKKSNFPFLAMIAGMVLIFVLVLIYVLGGGKDPAPDPEIAAGIAYLESLEKKDPAQVQAVRKEIHQKHLDAQRDALLKQLNDGTLDPFSLFKDYVVMGDSRAVGFWYRDFLDKNRVLADGGHTIRNISSQMDTLVALNPSVIYLCYGLNDISIGYWKTADSYVAEYVQCVKEIQSRLPDATIVVSSILPARDPAFDRSAKWRNIPAWSAELEKACNANGILFANCDSLAVDYPKLWDPDGIHFREDFYPHWASILVITTLMEDA